MGKNLAAAETIFLFCDGSSCQKAGSEKVVREGRAYLRNKGLSECTHTIKTHCNGRCEDAPTCIVHPGNHWYKKMTPEKIIQVIDAHTLCNQPKQEYLLFSEGWPKVKSENERPPLKPKNFALKNISGLGECWITKGFSSDQYLYPLLQFIAANNHAGTIQLKDEAPLNLNALQSVKYEAVFMLEMCFTKGRTRQLTIGKIPDTQPQDLVESKVTTTEYYYQTGTGSKGIQFKNKKGDLLGRVHLDQNDAIWDYCLDIMLGGLRLPQLNHTP